MIFLPFLFISAQSDDEFWKTICICKTGKCSASSTKCDSLSTLDPTSSTFMEDFNYIRKNIKNVEIYYNNKNDEISLEFDMRSLAGLTLNFTSLEAKVMITFKYINNDEYNGCFFTFDDKYYPTFIPKEDSKSVNILQIGEINAKNQVTFCLNGDKITILKFSNLGLNTSSLVNISRLDKSSVGKTLLRVGASDTLDVKFTKGKPVIKINESNLDFTYVKGDSYAFAGEYTKGKDNGDKLKMSFEDGVSLSDIPSFEFGSISTVEFVGKLWAPSKTNQIWNITNVRNIIAPSGDFPFSIYSDDFNFIVNGDITVYGNIDAFVWSFSTAEMNITTPSKSKVNVTFKGYVDSEISIQSPYLNLYIDNYSNNNTVSRVNDFPIGFSFNEESASYVYVKSTNRKLKASRFICFPTISNIYTDEYLDNNKIIKGFVFLDFPKDYIDLSKFRLIYDFKSPSVTKGIPGFGDVSNCMSIEYDKSDSIKFKALKYKTAYSTPAYICLSDGSRCTYNTHDGYPYVDVTTFDDQGDLSLYINEGFREIIIESRVTNRNITIDFDKLPNNNYNITIFGYLTAGQYNQKQASSFILKASAGKIYNLSIRNSYLSESFNFNMPIIDLKQVIFNNQTTYTIGDNSVLTTDDASLDSLNQISEKPNYKELIIDHNYEYLGISNYEYTFEDYIEINDHLIDTCVIRGNLEMYSKHLSSNKTLRWGEKSFCASNIDTKYIQKLTIISRKNLGFKVVSVAKDISPINIIIHPKTIYTYLLTLTGDGWNSTIDKKFTVDHDDELMIASVSKPDQANNINFVGNGTVIYKVDYGAEKRYCVFNEDYDKSCSADAKYGTILYSPENLSEITKINNYSVSIKLDLSNDTYKIPNSFFDRKKVTLTSTSSSGEKSKFELDTDNLIVDRRYSLAVFDNVNGSYSKSTDVTYTFGQLKLNNFDVNDAWKQHVKLDAAQLICEYDDLKKFKNITIADQLNLTGALPTTGEELVIDFVEDEDEYDLVADISNDVTIHIGKGYVKIGSLTFKISHSRNYDAYFVVKGKINLIIESEVSLKHDFMKFKIDFGSFDTNISFVGVFPEIPPADESLIQIISIGSENKCNVTTGTSIPLSIVGFGKIEFHFLSNSITTIQGPIIFNEHYSSSWWRPADKSYSPHKYFNHQSQIINLNIPLGYILTGIEKESNLTAIMEGNIHLTIGKVTKKYAYINSNISFVNTISNSGSSQVFIKGSLPENVNFRNKTFILMQVTGKIEDEMSFPFIKKPETVVKGVADNFISLDFSVIYMANNLVGLSHGFSPSINCLGLKQFTDQDNYHEIQLYAEKLPSEFPFVIDYAEKGTKTDAELIIDEDNIESLSTFLPKSFVGLVLRIRKNMISAKSLKLAALLKDVGDVSIIIQSIGNSPLEIYLTVPSNKKLNITFINVRIGFDTDSKVNFISNLANFTDCEFLNGRDFVISNEVNDLHMDVDSFNELVSIGAILSYNGNMNVNSANVILFTKDGWEFREDRARSTVPIRADQFKNIVFETRKFCLLMLKDDSLTSIKPFKFNSFPGADNTVYFELSRYWGRIKDLGGFKINVNGAERVNLNTASYPIPSIFDIADSNISYTFETDVKGGFDTLVLENNRVFRDENLIADLQFLPPEYQYVYGDRVTFDGADNILFQRNVGTLRVNESIFEEKSTVTISKLETLRKMSVNKGVNLKGIFKFSLTSTIEMRWTLKKYPLIIHQNFSQGTPKEIELIYDDSSVDYNLFRNILLNKFGFILMKGNFECFSMKNHVKFGGNFQPFGAGNNHLSVVCDSISEGQVLLLQGVGDFTDDEDSQSGSKGAKITSGGVAGIVIVCAIVVGAVAAGVVYYSQRIKIDRLKNEIPAENNETYRTNSNEDQSSADYVTRDSDDEF